MKEMLPKFEHVGVMVIGDVMLDRYWYGITSCISPEAPVPLIKVETIEERPGGAANVAMNIASLGAYSYLIGLTGADEAAHTLSTFLSRVNVKCDFISVATHPTIIKLRVISRNQQLIRLDFEEKFDGIEPELIHKRINQNLDKIRVLVLSDYAKGALKNVQKIIELARNANLPVLIDPKCADFSCYRGATLLTPNLLEFEAVVGKCKTEKELVDHGMKVIDDFELSALLVTLSEHGMILLQSNRDPLRMPTQSKKVYDVTGAGDTLISVLAATLAAGNSLEEACYFANVAAGIVVGKLGVSTVSPIELERAVHSWNNISFGMISEKELKIAVDYAHKKGEKVVMTNGVFDILHAGHIAYLANARKLGDRLIVAVNSDSSAKRLKGKSRPINSLEQRMVALGALKVVDWVVSFKEDTPQRLIANILPDLLVKGGDYKPEQIAGSKEVWANGGEVIVLNFEDGYSSTSVIKKLSMVGNKYAN